ncbi:hypothetical protein CLOM_g2484 [Closterium sp. NIES-68]|nr:hypothetical protein CLOM_g2484 [Closterium sp. NIES-68]GJP74324.1 hypothetical protein CLOP_g4921 [Closterium sp. NIES-67]
MARHLHTARSVPDVHNMMSDGLETSDVLRPEDQSRTRISSRISSRIGPRHRHQKSDGFILFDSQGATNTTYATAPHLSPIPRDRSPPFSLAGGQLDTRGAGDIHFPLLRSHVFDGRLAVDSRSGAEGPPPVFATGLPPRRWNSFHNAPRAESDHPGNPPAHSSASAVAPPSSSRRQVFASVADSSDDDGADDVPQDMHNGRVSQRAGYPPRQYFAPPEVSYYQKQLSDHVLPLDAGEPLKEATEAVLRARAQEVLAERHELSQQLSSFRVTAAYRKKRVEATLKETDVLRAKLGGGEKRLEKVQAQFDATRIAQDAAARELAVLRRIAAPATSDDSDFDSVDDSDEMTDSDGEDDATSGRRGSRRGGTRRGLRKPLGDAAWRRAELQRVLQDMAQTLEKTEKRARSAMVRTMQLESLLEDRKEQLGEVRGELRTAQGERDMLAEELQEAFNSWANPRAPPVGNAMMTPRVTSAPLPLQPQRATDWIGLGMWGNEGKSSGNAVKGGSRSTRRISRSVSKEELGARMRGRGMGGRGNAEELGGWARASALLLAGQLEPRVPGYLCASLEV